MKKKFIKPKDISAEKFVNQLEKDMGVTLIAKDSTIQLNGYVSVVGDVVEVVFYDKNELANYTEGIYRNMPYHHGHKNDYIKPKGKTEDLFNKVEKGAMI